MGLGCDSYHYAHARTSTRIRIDGKLDHGPVLSFKGKNVSSVRKAAVTAKWTSPAFAQDCKISCKFAIFQDFV